MSDVPHKQRHVERRALWGRAQGRPLSGHQAKMMETLLPKIQAVPDSVSSSGSDILSTFADKTRITLEIGFGGGEHILHCAKENPEEGFIGAEPFLNGVAKTLVGIDKDGLSNIRIHHGDVRAVLDLLPDACLDCVYILYPDPWPKPRHYKRRLIQEDFIAEIYRVLKPDAELRFASDIISYVDWALARILRHESQNGGKFFWDAETAQAWRTPYAGWPSTRYEAKAFREGRTAHYFTFVKT